MRMKRLRPRPGSILELNASEFRNFPFKGRVSSPLWGEMFSRNRKFQPGKIFDLAATLVGILGK